MEDLSIQTVSLLSGVSKHTLRAWEKRYSAITPRRTKTGRRLFKQSDIHKVKLLNQLTAMGYSISSIATKTNSELESLACKILAPTPTPQTLGNIVETEVKDCIKILIQYLSKFEIDLLNQELNRARIGFTVRTFILQLIPVLMTEVGALVKNATLGIAHEHVLSSLLRGYLIQIFHSLNLKTHRNLRVILTTPEGDLHEFGILSSAILCASHGLAVQYLGPNLPPKDLAQAATATNANFVLLGATKLPAGTTKTSLKNYLKTLSHAIKSPIEIIVGGHCNFNPTKVYFTHPVKHIQTLEALDIFLSSKTFAIYNNKNALII